jgi:hypothetical protein
MFCAPRPTTNVFDQVTHLIERGGIGRRSRRRHVEASDRAAGGSLHDLVRPLRTGALPACDARRQGSPASPDPAQLVDTVLLLESTAIALGAPALTSNGVRSARDADDALRACSHDPSAAARWAHVFHQTLLAACPNEHLLSLICREASRARPSDAPLAIGRDELDRVADDHDAILDMIAAGASPRELERSLREHAATSALCSPSMHRV